MAGWLDGWLTGRTGLALRATLPSRVDREGGRSSGRQRHRAQETDCLIDFLPLARVGSGALQSSCGKGRVVGS
jgi:hypothetical protein